MHKTRLFTLLALFGIISASAQAMGVPSLADIRNTATRFVETHLQKEQDDYQVSAQALDPRLRLAACSGELSALLPFASQANKYSVVEVSCDGSQPWSIHVPVDVKIFGEVLVTSRAIAQGSVLSKADFSLRRSEISQLSGGYVTNIDAAIGQVSTRPMRMGQPVLTHMLKPAVIVRRGQSIRLLARNKGFEVSSSGESLMDGAIGERIRVRNHRSRRIVEGIIAKNGVVYVN